jgi:glycosyltransferase involved in cell wall biosynthesis/nucleoside-diphosphate-sugar epimerase
VVVGDGMMAKAFAAFAQEPGVVIFASGVSDSTEISAAAFKREEELLRRIREQHPGALLVYFGTCSVHDPDSRDTPYVAHKLRMESILENAPGPWLVLRLPLAIGPGHRGRTLARFLHQRIVRQEPFQIWGGATRYPIDVEDVVRIARRLIGERSNWNRRINIALQSFPVHEFVRAMEAVTGMRANFTLLPKGHHYALECPEVVRLADDLQLDFSPGYLERVLRKYYAASAQPRISVVVAVFNGAATLQRCIDSVLHQSYADRELILIDGGSTDGTQEILRRNSANLAYWVSEPDHGIYHAWNKALPHARGEWICFLGADDYLWAPDTLERLAPVLASAYPPVRVVYGQVALVNERGGEMQRVGEDWGHARRRFTEMMCLPHTGLMQHRSLFEVHGAFDESYRAGGDYEMLLRELRTGEALFVPDLVVAGMGYNGVSTNPAGSLRVMREFRQAQVKHGFERPSWRWRLAFWKAHLRVWLWRALGDRYAPYVFDALRVLSGKKPYWTRQ